MFIKVADYDSGRVNNVWMGQGRLPRTPLHLNLKNQLRRLSSVGYHSYMLSTRRHLQQCSLLKVTCRFRRFSQLLEETEHFCCWDQKKVAKIVQCGER